MHRRNKTKVKDKLPLGSDLTRHKNKRKHVRGRDSTLIITKKQNIDTFVNNDATKSSASLNVYCTKVICAALLLTQLNQNQQCNKLSLANFCTLKNILKR